MKQITYCGTAVYVYPVYYLFDSYDYVPIYIDRKLTNVLVLDLLSERELVLKLSEITIAQKLLYANSSQKEMVFVDKIVLARPISYYLALKKLQLFVTHNKNVFIIDGANRLLLLKEHIDSSIDSYDFMKYIDHETY